MSAQVYRWEQVHSPFLEATGQPVNPALVSFKPLLQKAACPVLGSVNFSQLPSELGTDPSKQAIRFRCQHFNTESKTSTAFTVRTESPARYG